MRILTITLLAALTMVFGTACSEKTMKSVGPDIGGTSGTTGGNTGSSSTSNHWNGGATTTLEQTNGAHAAVLEDLATYAGLDTNDVQDLSINLDVSGQYVFGVGKYQYGGTLKLGYNNRYGTQYDFQEVEADVGYDVYSTQFNMWVRHGNEDYIKMFFETETGAFLFVGFLNDDLGLLSGRLFFKRHDFERCSDSKTYPWPGCGPTSISFNQSPPRNCWTTTFHNNGVYVYYDCRAYFNGTDGLPNMAQSIYPNQGRYKEIGRFDNLDMAQAGINFPQ